MKTINAVDLWQARRMATYARLLAAYENALEDPGAPRTELTVLRRAIYRASGTPFGSSPLAEWAWWEFDQWSTTN
ncbi:MAG TPA: hypothetical protein VF190_05315 [Rhodothermales bacterium]